MAFQKNICHRNYEIGYLVFKKLVIFHLCGRVWIIEYFKSSFVKLTTGAMPLAEKVGSFRA